MNFKPAGLQTGIGSMPYIEPGEALDLIFKTMPDIPHWPQMPLRGAAEGFVFQFLTPLVKAGLIKLEKDKAFFNTDSEHWEDGLTQFYSIYLAAVEGDEEALESFALPVEAAAGFYAYLDYIKENGLGEAVYLKGHLAGPLTIGFNLKDPVGKFSYYDDQLRDLIVKTLAMHSRWQAKKLSDLGRPVIIFIDEPGIGVYGKSDYITVTKEMIKCDLDEIFEQVHIVGALAGVHSCDAIDWSILYNCNLEIVNLDVYNFADSLIPFATELKSFIDRGGILAQGIIPTNEKAFDETRDSLLERLKSLWKQLELRGIATSQLLQQTMITPACGTGLLEPTLAVHIHNLTSDVSSKVKEWAI